MIIIDDNFTNVMLDLETLGTKSNSAITQIGACVLNESEASTDFHVNIDIDSCLRFGFGVDGSTLRWWMEQSDEARKAFAQKTKSITGALIDFQVYCTNVERQFEKPVVLWGNSAGFDCGLLSNAYTRCKYKQPWDFRNERCYRTVKNQFPEVPEVVPKIAHNALSDAEAQAKHLVNLATLNNFGRPQ